MVQRIEESFEKVNLKGLNLPNTRYLSTKEFNEEERKDRKQIHSHYMLEEMFNDDIFIIGRLDFYEDTGLIQANDADRINRLL